MSSDRTAGRWSPVVIGDPVVDFEPRPPHTRTYRPDTAVDGWSAPGFTVRAASVRGYQHRHDGAPRQDDFAVSWHPGSGAVVVAVADGVSSVELAHVGATLACRTTIDYLLRWLDEPSAEPDWLDLARCASWALVDFAGKDAAEAERLLATTLVVALVWPDSGRASVARIGDSAAWTLSGGVWQAIDGTVDELVNAPVTALPRVPTEVAAIEVDIPAGGVLVLGTDGLSGPLGDGSGPVGERFTELLRQPPTPLDLAHLLDFSRETFDDDRTLVAVWPT